MKLKRSFAVGCAAVAVALAALLAVNTALTRSRRIQRLPDGSFLELVSVSYGTNHSYALPLHQPWKEFAVTHLPRSWTARLGWWASGGSVGWDSGSGEAGLAIFTVCEQAQPTSFASPELVLCDEKGNICGSGMPGPSASDAGGKRDWALVCWRLSTPPRSAKRLILRFSQLAADGRTREQVAEFDIPNPLTDTDRD